MVPKVQAKPPPTPPPPPPNVSYRFLTNPNLIIIYARTCATRRVENIYSITHCSTQVDEEGVAGRRFLASTTLRHYIYIDIDIIIFRIIVVLVCAGTGCRYNDNSYCCILYTPAGPIVRACGGGASSVGRTTAHLDNCHPTTATIYDHYDDYDDVTTTRVTLCHRAPDFHPSHPPKTRPGDLVTMAHHAGVDFTINYASPFSSPTHTYPV